jgi:hypothetical protein
MNENPIHIRWTRSGIAPWELDRIAEVWLNLKYGATDWRAWLNYQQDVVGDMEAVARFLEEVVELQNAYSATGLVWKGYKEHRRWIETWKAYREAKQPDLFVRHWIDQQQAAKAARREQRLGERAYEPRIAAWAAETLSGRLYAPGSSRVILEALVHAGGNIARAAKLVGQFPSAVKSHIRWLTSEQRKAG